MNKDWEDDNKLNLLINYCLNIENTIKDLNIINSKLKEYNESKDSKVIFIPDINNEKYKLFEEKLNNFGQIFYKQGFLFSLRKCPLKIDDKRKYAIDGEKQNILTKTGIDNYYCGTICTNELKKHQENKWKIKILKSKRKLIYIGVSTNYFDIESPSLNTGWYFKCSNQKLFSSLPQNYNEEKSNIKKEFDEIIVIMDMNMGKLKFILDNEDKYESFTDIPLNNSLYPSIILNDINDSIEIDEC